MSDPAAARTDVTAINRIKRLSSQALLAGMIGNILEWYDFGLYGYLAPVIGAHFFPRRTPSPHCSVPTAGSRSVSRCVRSAARSSDTSAIGSAARPYWSPRWC